jgi:phosphate starvation-inducible PhoH-like protein
MTKRAVKRMMREGEFDAAQFDEARGEDWGGKIRRLPVSTSWSPVNGGDREQGYVKTVKPQSPGQSELMTAIDAHNLVLALGPAGTGKTYLAIAKAVEALERARSAASCCRARRSRRASRSASCRATWRTSSRPICGRFTTPCPTGCR